MNPKLTSLLACGLAFIFCFASQAKAQTDDRIGKTWKGPDSSLIANILKNRSGGKPSTGTAKPRAEVLKFTPAGDSGVAKALAEAFGSSEEQRGALAEAFVGFAAGAALLAPVARAKNFSEKPALTDANVNRLFSQDERGRDLTQEQINALAKEAMQSLTDFLDKHFALDEVRDGCVRTLPDGALAKLNEMLARLPEENGRLTTKFVRRSDMKSSYWVVSVTTDQGSYVADIGYCWPRCR